MRFPVLSILLIAAFAPAAWAESVNTVFTQTRDCFDCPMGVAGDLSIKVCGNRGCCFTFRLDNGENNFSRGKYDEFSGLGVLGECDNFDVSAFIQQIFASQELMSKDCYFRSMMALANSR